MDFPAGRKRRIYTGLVILFFCLVSLSGSPDSVIITAETSPERLAAGEQLLVSFDVPFQITDSAEIEIHDPPELEGLVLARGPFRNFIRNPLEDSLHTRVRVYFLSRSHGLKLLPEISVTGPDGTIYRLEEQLFRIGEYDRRVLRYPLEMDWVLPHRTVYVGETLPVMLQVFNQPEILFLDTVSVTAPQGVFFEKTSGLMDIHRRIIAGKTLYDVPAAVYMFIASAPGRYFIPAATVQSGDSNGRSSTVAIDVQALPEQVRKTGAVGDFAMSYQISPDALTVGQEAVLELMITGAGNLPFLTVSNPLYSDSPLSLISESADIQADMEGFHGRRIFRYSMVPDQYGTVLITINDFPYLADRSGQVRVLPGQQLEFLVRPAETVQADNRYGRFESFVPFASCDIQKMQRLNIYRLPASYLSLLPLPAGFLFMFLMRRKAGIWISVSLILFISSGFPASEDDYRHLDAAFTAWEEHSYTESGRLFEEALDVFPGNPALFYNMAICQIRSEALTEGLFLARKARRLYPRDKIIVNLVVELEDELGLQHQIAVPLYLHPDLAFIIMVIAINALAVLGIFFLYRRSILNYITAVFFAVIVIGSIAALVHGSLVLHADLATVNQMTYLKRIPRISAEDWLGFPEGTAVQIHETTDGFFLVENGTGIRGWISGGFLYRHKDEESWRDEGFWIDP